MSAFPDCHASRAVNKGGKEGTEQSCADAEGAEAARAAMKKQKTRWYTIRVIKINIVGQLQIRAANFQTLPGTAAEIHR